MVKIGDIELGKFPLLLAPMEDVSDPPFRALLKINGKPKTLLTWFGWSLLPVAMIISSLVLLARV